MVSSNFQAYIGQIKKVILVYSEGSRRLSECLPHGTRWFRHIHVPGHIYRAHHTHLLVEDKNSFQIVLPGRMKFP